MRCIIFISILLFIGCAENAANKCQKFHPPYPRAKVSKIMLYNDSTIVEDYFNKEIDSIYIHLSQGCKKTAVFSSKKRMLFFNPLDSVLFEISILNKKFRYKGIYYSFN